MFGMESEPFFGRKILVTGAAHPLSRALALALVRRGAQVLALDSDHGGLADLARESAGAIEVQHADAANPAEAAAIASWLRSAHVNLAGLIAGPGPTGPALSLEVAPRIARLIRANPAPFAALLSPTDANLHAAPFRSREIPVTLAEARPGRTADDCARLAPHILDGIGRGRAVLALEAGQGRARFIRRLAPAWG